MNEPIATTGWMVTTAIVKNGGEIGHEMYAVAVADPGQAARLDKDPRSEVTRGSQDLGPMNLTRSPAAQGVTRRRIAPRRLHCDVSSQP
jgi:hypothetical protein